MGKRFVAVVLAMTVFAVIGLSLVEAQDKAKFTIKEVMKDAHKSGLYKKVGEGKATKEEKEKLVELYTSLAQNKPPKGDLEAWKKQTEAMLAAAKGSLKDEKEEQGKLLALVKCGDCHGKFKQ
jgi:mono/diheme cytochrome c family protein